MIIETSCNQLFQVRETNDPDLPHVWFGIAVKAKKVDGVVRYVPKSARIQLVRKAATRVVEA